VATSRRTAQEPAPAVALEALAEEARSVAKKTKKHHQNLARNNFYGNKLAQLRTDASNVFRELTSQSAGDAAALAELMQAIFAPETPSQRRLEASRELSYALRTTWRQSSISTTTTDRGLVPLAILAEANRGYLVSIGRQINGCYAQGWYDACAVMMRRLIEIAIIEAFEHKKMVGKIKDAAGNYLHLSDLIAVAMAEPTISLSRNTKKMLPQLRDVGHMSAHGRYFHARKEDVENVRSGFRVVVEEFLHHASLL
jgi:hypothetical protein